MRPTHLLLASACVLVVVGCSAGGDPKGTTSVGPGSGGQNTGGSSGAGDGGSSSTEAEAAVVVGSSATGSFQGEECGREGYGAQVPASILIVLDKSGSMAGGEGVPDKWAPTVSALTLLTSTAPTELKMGLLPFPVGDCDVVSAGLADGCCEDVSPSPAVQVKSLAVSGPEIVAWLDSHGPSGGTPTLFALEYGYNVLKTIDTDGERFLLLVTDGEPQVYAPPMFGFPASNLRCGTTEDMVAEAAAASAGDPVVKTFVIGAPGSEGAADFFTQIAAAGLTAPNGYFQIGSANYADDLEAALDAITGQVSDCVFALPEGEDVDPAKVNVVIETANGEVEIFRDEAHVNGWDYTDASQTKIQLFGEACVLYKSAADNRITIVIGCETVVK